MIKNWKKIVSVVCFCGAMSAVPFTAYGDTVESGQVSVDADEDRPETDEDLAADTVTDEEVEAVLRVIDRTSEARLQEENGGLEAEGTSQDEEAVRIDKSMSFRQEIVDYALSFLGGPYRYGGSDPRTGVDCSGFVRFVLSNAGGIQIPRSSRAQATQGIPITPDEMRPGDLIFYGGSGGINHVAMYIGSGKIVHASTYKTGIKISNWNYRTPVQIMDVIG